MATASLSAIRQALPRGNTLDDAAFATRHGWLCWLLGLHVPALVVYGMVQGFGFEHSLTAVWVPMACLLAGLHLRQRRVVAAVVTIGLVSCSTILVHLAGGATEAHVHFFVILAFIGLYQDWVPFVGAAAFAIGSTVAAPDGLFVDAAHDRPLTWTILHGVAVLFACSAQIVFWQATEREQEKGVRLARDLERAQAQIDARESVSELFVNLARRNQALLDRQINLLVAMEEREADPDQLAELFQLDHLATRIRRNAESLLVLSGEEPARRWGRPVPLTDVVRAAIAEVEDFRRADMSVDEGLAVAGRAVADMAHLLAEVIENGLQFSPPESRVRVTSQLRSDGACIVLVEDHGIGMPDADLAAANELLAHPPEVDIRLSKRLGFHVVARLATRYRVRVRLSATPGGGVTVAVGLPDDLVAERDEAVVSAAAPESNGSGPAPAPALIPNVAPRPARPPAAARAHPTVPTVAGRPLVDPTTLPVARRTAEAVAAPAPPPLPTVPPEPVAAPVEVPAAWTDPAPALLREPETERELEPALPSAGESVDANGAGSPAPLFAATPLPRRVPQSSLDPRMREPSQPAATAPAARPSTNRIGGRSPEELRARLSQFQAAQAQARHETSAHSLAGRGEEQ